MQSDAGGNVNVAGGLTVGGSFSLNTVNAQTQYNLGGNRILSAAGTQNLFVGLNAGRDNSTGFLNTFVGSAAGQGNTTGDANSFFGANAGASNKTGGDNSFFGDGAGLANVVGTGNSFFGRQAGLNNTANDNSFFGAFAGLSNTTGLFNTLLGAHAGDSNTTGNGNTYVGTSSGAANQSGSNNSFLGLDVGRNNTASANSFFGALAGQKTPRAAPIPSSALERGKQYTLRISNSAFFGATDRLVNNTTGTKRIHSSATVPVLRYVTGSFNTFVGRQAGLNNTADNNSFFGYFAGKLTRRAASIAFGFRRSVSGLVFATRPECQFIFRQCPASNTTGTNNSFFGDGCGQRNRYRFE